MSAQSSRGFAEKVAVVTDGANAFGRALALQLALQGCYVVVGFAASSAESARALGALQEIGTLANAVECDVSDFAGIAKLFEQVENMYGRLDLLVNSAQFHSPTDLFAMGENDFTEIINRNLKTAFFSAQAAARLMQPRPNAAIVNLIGESENSSSVLASSVQAALIGLTKSLATRLAPKIRVNCVSFLINKMIDDGIEANLNSLELLRPATLSAPDDVARAAIYLLSSEAAAITGQTVSVGAKRSRI